MQRAQFVHLNVHSQYSILNSTASVESLAEKASDYEMTALALTDYGNLFGAVDFYKACKEFHIKPIIGCKLYLTAASRFEKNRNQSQIILLAKNKEGYRNICKLSSIGYVEGFYYYPRIDEETLVKYSSGLICIVGGISCPFSEEILSKKKEQLIQQINRFKNLFKEDFYFDLQRHPMTEEQLYQDEMTQESWLVQQHQEFVAKQNKINDALVIAAQELNVKCVATNAVHYVDRTDWKAHEILMNIQSGEPCEIWEKDFQGNLKLRMPNPKRRVFSSHEFYFKSAQQMASLFADIPESLSTSLEIADKCELEIDFKSKHYPVYIPPSLEGRSFTKEEQAKAVEKYLWQLCEEGIPNRYTQDKLQKVQEIYPDKDPHQVVRDRLNYEMDVIVPKGMADYLLIVWDFINWAKNKGIPVGPGRGSGAGSIVLYLIGVTDIEPLRFHLFFERFINPERISYPDIDVDICMDRRGEVINYTLQKYGKDNISQIITFGTMKAKMTIKDVGRVLNVPLSKVNEIAKLVPDDLNITLTKALEKDFELRNLYERDQEVQRIIDIGKKLEGSIRNTGIHAAGIIISGEPLTEYIPICISKDSEMPVTQYSMKPVELVGMLKVDFLGLKTLTAIQICIEAIRKNSGISIDYVNLPLNDTPTFALMNQGKTLGVFQMESGGMQELARELHLDKFEEIIAVVSLYRPGPMDMIPSFINRKHGREEIDNDHPWMKDILAETYGIMVYQEQVMQIASKLANYSLGEGDVLRRAMGKKDMEQMAKQREKFRTGALQNGIDEETSMKIFDKMEKFAAYGFNKSHAAAYGYLSYVTAYLKANYPNEWMASLMTCDLHDLSKIAKFIHECQLMNIPILPPDINEAGAEFIATPQGIRFAMTGIKGIGEGVVEAIIQERNQNGAFTSLYQFFKRIETKKIGKKAVENLIEAGAFDFIGWSRDELLEAVDPIYDTVQRDHKESAQGILSFFSLMGDSDEHRFSTPPPIKRPRSTLELLLKEKELLGFFLTGHPMDGYREILDRLSCVSLRKLDTLPNEAIFRSAFIVESANIRLSAKTQKKFAILTISDGIHRHELPIWSDLYEEKSPLLRENQLLYAVLQLDRKEEPPKLACKWLDDLTQANESMIAACDQAYEKAKYQSARFSKKIQKKPQKQEQEQVRMEKKLIILTFDIEKLKMSHVLKIKEIFNENSGSVQTQIHFVEQGKPVAKLHLHLGIREGSQLEDKLKAFPAFITNA